MSVATLEKDLDQYLTNSGYEVRFSQCFSIHVSVLYQGTKIADREYLMCRWRAYSRGAKWALRQIRAHQKAMRTLGGLVRTP